MRNPWGNEYEWKGDWNDGDDKNWTPSLREQHNMVVAKPDGRFFMPYSDFVEWFDQYAICMYEDSYILSSFQDALEPNFKGCYKIDIAQEGDYFISLSQPD
jgi:calpain-15